MRCAQRSKSLGIADTVGVQRGQRQVGEVQGDQQVEGENFTASDLYAPVLKSQKARSEAWLILAIAAAEGCSVYKTDTSQAFLYCSMGDDVVYIKAPDW